MVKEYVGAEITLLSRVLKAPSYAFAYGGRNPMWAGWWLKTLGKSVHMNDLLHFSYMDSVGMVENDGVMIDEFALANLLEGLGRVKPLENPELAKLVSLEDAYFFDQLRPRIERLPPRQRGMALRAGFNTIRYSQVMDSGRFQKLRMPLERIFTNEVLELNKRVTASGHGSAYQSEAGTFVQRQLAQVLYIQFPLPTGIPSEFAVGSRPRGPLGREIWTRGPSRNWLPELRASVKGTLGDRFTSRDEYLRAISVFLDRAQDYPVWVFNLAEDEYGDVARVVAQHRRPKGVNRFDTREASGGYMSYFLVAER